MKEIAEKLKELRIKSGLSQEKLAEQLNVSRQAVSKWETGEALPDMENMIALARLYNTSLDELAGIIVDKKEDDNQTTDHGSSTNADIHKNGESVRINLNGINIRVNGGGKNININGDGAEGDVFDDMDDPLEDLDDTIEDIEDAFEELDGENVDINIAGKIKIGDDGININNGKIRINEDGISINDGRVKIDSAGVIIDDDGKSPTSGIVRILRAVPYPIVVTVAYFLLGALADAWGIAWILFCTIPVYYGIVECIRTLKVSNFPFVTLTPCIYLYLGMQYGLWHPAWIIFLTIPIFYPIACAIDKAIANRKSKNSDIEN